ncbi:MAG TPA: tyrosine-protein phosphatase [Gaiellaceae bacterium]
MRVLAWDGCVNVRDLGGLPVLGGGETRFGSIVRADSVRHLTRAGWDALAQYGTKLVIDLRSRRERDEDEPGDTPLPVLHIPITPDDVPDSWSWPSMRAAYLGLLETYGTEYGAVVDAVATTEGPVVIHCAGGRDRTGLAVALMLSLLPVEDEAIAADHALSDESFAPYQQEWIDRAADERERERRRRVSVPAGRTMVGILAEVGRRYGGAEAYLRAGGAKAESLELVRRRLLPNP